jgi:hypothetical protein
LRQATILADEIFLCTYYCLFDGSNRNLGTGYIKLSTLDRFNLSYNLSEQWKIGGDVGYRIEPSANFHVAYLRPGINYKPNKIINFNVGIANFNSSAAGDFIKSEL